MDRRTQLAFALIALILVANLVIMERMAPPPEERAAEGTPATEAVTPGDHATPNPPGTASGTPTTSDTASPGAHPPAQAGTVQPGSPGAASTDVATLPRGATGTAADGSPLAGIFPLATGDEPDLVIETPLERVRLARAGGGFREIRLFAYEHALTGEPVNLVPDVPLLPQGRAFGVRLHTAQGTADLSRARFEVAGDLPDAGVVRVDASTGPRTITLRAPAESGGAVLLRYTFHPDTYEIGVDLELERGGHLQQIEDLAVEWTAGLPSTEANEKDDLMSFKLFARVNGELTHQGMNAGFFESITGRGPKGEKVTPVNGEIDWLAMKSKYFMVALMPETQKNGVAHLRGDGKLKWIGIDFTNPVPWRGTTRESYTVYAGPISYDLLKAQGRGLESIVDLGWRWVRPFSWVVLGFMKFLHQFISNYGVIILIISILTKLIFWPLSEKSFKSMREMQQIQPLMQSLRERYKDDPQEMNRQVMALYKQHGVNPFGGCMPLLVQMPIFVALFSVLRSNIELRNAPFVGWIDNLAAPDVMAKLPFTLPFIGDNLSLLPILMGGAMIWQSAMGSPMGAMSGPAAQQQKLMKWLMPIMFTVFFYNMPSGLVLYWLVNTVFSVLQQVRINSKYGAAPVVSPAAPPAAPAAGGERTQPHGTPSNRSNRSDRRRGSRNRSGKVGSKSR